MKTLPGISSVLLSLFFLVVISCSGGNRKEVQNPEKADLKVVVVSVGGMTCTGCEQTIQTGVAKIEGVKSVKASHTEAKAYVEFDASLADTAKIRTAITGSGYRVNSFAFADKSTVTF